MIVVVDGTGPDSDIDYETEMANSFCKQIASQAAGATYFRGPTLTGSEVKSIAAEATRDAAALADRGLPIMLAGYSRGGCTVINVAYNLQAAGQDVAAMFLFDAVDMQTSSLRLTQTIPSNVSFVAHARTARSAMFWLKNPNKSRWYFYNTGRYLAGDGTFEERKFIGTHGAAGGVPWPDIPGEASCAAAVAEWMNPFLVGRGLPSISLKRQAMGSGASGDW